MLASMHTHTDTDKSTDIKDNHCVSGFVPLFQNMQLKCSHVYSSLSLNRGVTVYSLDFWIGTNKTELATYYKNHN